MDEKTNKMVIRPRPKGQDQMAVLAVRAVGNGFDVLSHYEITPEAWEARKGELPPGKWQVIRELE